MKTLKKLLLISCAVIISATSFGQSNKPGTIQLGLGWNVAVGGATIKYKNSNGEQSDDATGIKALYGLRAQYGLSENLSAGIYARAEGAVYTTSFATNYYSTGSDVTYSGTGFGVEAKYYLVNKDKFNLSPNLAVGFTTGKGEPDFGTSTDLSGLAYGLGVGINWYFAAETFGLSADLGYGGTSLTGSNSGTDVTVTSGGLNIGFGFTVKFGGK